RCRLATANPDLPVLTRIASTPVVGRTGKLLTDPGYHPDARLLYHPVSGFVVPRVPDRPTPGEIAPARPLLEDETLAHVRLPGPAEKAHAMAMLLLGFLRSMISG